MYRIKLVGLLCMLGVITSLSQGTLIAHELIGDTKTDDIWAEDACSRSDADEQIETIARMMVEGGESKEGRNCYDDLKVINKARVFEAVAQLRGFSVEDLREDAQGMNQFPQATLMAGWDQLVERVPFSAVGRPLVSAIYYFQNSTICDGDASDDDYIFVYGFPSNMTNPDALRVFSSNWLVDSMLVYYQVSIGGLKGFGDTSNPYVNICVGDTGVSTAGGASNVLDKMKTHN